MSDAGFFVRMRGKTTGPFGTEDLRRLIRQGMLSRLHEISPDRENWTRAGEYEELYPAPPVAPSASEPEPQAAPVELDFVDVTPAPAPTYNMAPGPGYPTTPPMYPGQQQNYTPQPLQYLAPQPFTTGYARPRESHHGFALTGMILALCGLLVAGFIVGVIAVVFSAIAMAGMGRTGNNAGKGMAITGLVIGIVDVVFGLAWLGMYRRAWYW